MKKEITVKKFTELLIMRIEAAKDINCCEDEIRKLAKMASEKMGNEKIEVDWVD